MTPNEKDYWGIRTATFYLYGDVEAVFWRQRKRIRRNRYDDSPELKAARFLVAPHDVSRRNHFWQAFVTFL